MTLALMSHVVVDTDGVARIAGRPTRVIEVILDKLAYGWSPDEIQEQHPHLTLAQIHSAFAYYYDHQAELDSQIQVELREIEALRKQAGETAVTRKLRELGKLS